MFSSLKWDILDSSDKPQSPEGQTILFWELFTKKYYWFLKCFFLFGDSVPSWTTWILQVGLPHGRHCKTQSVWILEVPSWVVPHSQTSTSIFTSGWMWDKRASAFLCIASTDVMSMHLVHVWYCTNYCQILASSPVKVLPLTDIMFSWLSCKAKVKFLHLKKTQGI